MGCTKKRFVILQQLWLWTNCNADLAHGANYYDVVDDDDHDDDDDDNADDDDDDDDANIYTVEYF